MPSHSPEVNSQCTQKVEIVSLLPKIQKNAPDFGAGVTEAAGLLSGNPAPLFSSGEELLVEGEQKL